MNGEYESKDNQKEQFKQGLGLLQRLYFEQVVRPLLEQFGATQNPFWLGRALNAKPELLHEAGIRKLVIHYLKSTKERDQLIRGLKQKPKREKIKLPPGYLKFFYQAALKLIRDEYDRFKTKHGRKPKTQAERTMILRKSFPNLNRRTKKGFADELSRIPTLVAYKCKKPNEMAFYTIYHVHNTLYPGKVSVRGLKRAFGLKP